MNRLWVRISLVIALVAILITLSPLVARQVAPRPPFRPPPGEDLPPEFRDQIPPERIERYQDSISRRVWASAWTNVAGAAVLALGLGIWLSRGLVKPLTELEKGAKEVAAHNLSYRVPEEAGSAEMQAVARAFNEMAAELERQETLRQNMLADVTHELRHPVHVLRGNLQGIMDGVFSLEMEEVASLAEQTEHLSQLVNDLHELALAEARELPLHKTETVLNEVVRSAVDAVAPLATEEGIALDLALPDEEIGGHVDAARIRQAVQNLLSNAIRYTPAGGTITISLATTAGHTAITVQDTGIGIAEADLPFVFDRFYRSDTSRNRERRSAGLGLAIVKAIVEAHGGQVTATSPGADRGSTFTFTLPR